MKRYLSAAILSAFLVVGIGTAYADTDVTARALEYAPQELSEAETKGLLLMREEEKLARDVYAALADKWDIPIFGNIAKSEAQHMEMVRVLLERYGIEDPVADDRPGEYRDPALQALYDGLTEKGNASLEAALRVGAEVEELDIADLMKLMGEADNPDIRLVYQNLMKGSRNHLRSFDRQLVKRGGSYEPLHLEPEKFREIIGSSAEREPILSPDAPY